MSSYSKIEDLLQKSKRAVQEGGRQVNGIVVNSREKIHQLKDELIEVEARIAATIIRVDAYERKLDELRAKASELEEKYGKDDPRTRSMFADIKAYVENANEANRLEFELRNRRDNIELFLKEHGEILEKSEKVLKQMLVAISYLEIESLPPSDMTVLRVINSGDAEKRRLSREIHDGPAQSLVNIILTSEYAEKMVEIAPEKAKEEIKGIRVAAKDTLTDIRRIIFDLMPYTLTDYGLVGTLRTIIEDKNGIKFDLDIIENAKIANKDIENNLFRIAQELYSNIVRHSKATHGKIALKIDRDEIVFTAEDNGTGFDYNKKYDGYGLVSVADRVELLGGTIDIESKETGTAFRVTVPNFAEEPEAPKAKGRSKKK